MNDFEYHAELDYADTVDRIVERVNRIIDEKAVEQVEGRLAELGYRKCSTCTERRGYYLDAETIHRQQERIAELERESERWRKKSEMLEGYIEGPQGWRASCDAMRELIRDWEAYFCDNWCCGHDCGDGEDCPAYALVARGNELGTGVDV